MPIAIPIALAAAGTAGYAALGTGAAIGAGAIADTASMSLLEGASASTVADTASASILASVPEAATVGMTGLQELSLGSSVLSAGGSILSGLAQGKSAKYNAAIAANNAEIGKQNATATIQEGEANAAAASAASKAKIGGILANQGASGVDVNSGSSVDTRASAAEEGQLNAINIRSNAARAAYGYESGAANATAESNMYKSEATTAPIAGDISGVSTLLSGATNPVTSPFAKYLSDRSLDGGY